MKQHDFDPPFQRGDPLWDLLGRAKPVDVSPLFSRNVLREIRIARQPAAPRSLLSSWWRPALLGATGLAVLAVNGLVLMKDCEPTATVHSPTVTDVDAISNLDELLAYEPTDVWLDKTVY